MARVQALPIDGGLALSAPCAGTVEIARPATADVDTTVTYGTARAGDAGDEVAAWLERVLHRPCRLVTIAEGYRRPLLFDVGPPRTEVSFADAAPVLLTSTASLDDLVARATEPFAMDRFRPNLVVRGAHAWAEDTWRRARVGNATMHAALPWPRCAMPQVDQDTAERHKEPALVLRAHRWSGDAAGLGELAPLVANHPLFGVGVVAEPVGTTISVGDPVEILELGPRAMPAPPPLPAN
jgi:hypothetical protein